MGISKQNSDIPVAALGPPLGAAQRQFLCVFIRLPRKTPLKHLVGPTAACRRSCLTRVSYPMNTTKLMRPAHQSEKLIRHCLDRGVYSLKLVDKEKHCRVPYSPTEKSSGISEESIQEFCFAPRNIRPDRPVQVELWLNWINLSPEFLSRFVQAFRAVLTHSCSRLFGLIN